MSGKLNGAGFSRGKAANGYSLGQGVIDRKFKGCALVGAASGIANECSEARLAGFPERSPSVVQALNCEVIFSFSDCWNDEDVGIFLKVFERVEGRRWELRPVHFLRICDEEDFLGRSLELGHEFVEEFDIGFKVQGVGSCAIECVEDRFDLNGIIPGTPEENLGTAAHEYDAYGVSFLCSFLQDFARLCYRAFEAGKLTVVHAVGRINGDNHPNSFLSNGRIGVESDPHQRQCQECQGEATQGKNEQVFNLDLT